MSPEQINGAELDARSDLYSLGISLYELVTRARPFQGDSDYSIMAAHLEAKPVPPIQLDPSLPAIFNDIILMSIAKDPAQRFQTADAFRRALDSMVAAPIPKPAPLEPARQPVAPAGAVRSRRGVYMAVGSMVTVTVLALAALQGPKLFHAGSASSEPAPQPAVQHSSAPVQPELPSESKPEMQPPSANISADKQVTPRRQAARDVSPLIAQRRTSPAGAPPEQQSEVFQSKPPDPAPAKTPEAVAQQISPETAAMLMEMRDRLNLLDTRANSARGGIRTLREQQKAQGLGLRGDIETAEQRMLYHLTEAEAALKADDADKGKRSLDSAERALEQLEKFLGR
jgi:serine/threonine-protein kinase